MHIKNVTLVRIILRGESFFRFLKKLKESRNMKKNGKDIHIARIATSFGCQQVNFFMFSDVIRQSAAIAKTEIEVFIKSID